MSGSSNILLLTERSKVGTAEQKAKPAINEEQTPELIEETWNEKGKSIGLNNEKQGKKEDRKIYK